jgi:hypothetical protein
MVPMPADRPAPPPPPDRVERDGDGFVVPAEIIAPAFGLDPAAVPALMRQGTMTSQCETGVDADAGRWRLTVFHDGRALRLTVDADGQILSRATFAAARRGGAPGAGRLR